MRTKAHSSAFKTAAWLCLATLLGCALLFPETFLQGKSSFTVWSDYLIDYQSTFALTGFFYQGGLQLWDFFGQLPHVYFWVTHGMFRLPNVLTALVYVLFSPFAHNSAVFFNRVFALVYIGSLLCIRTIGIFLLLRRLTDDRWILRIATVAFALLFCKPAFLLGTFYQSFYPLLMYFILSFFLTWRLIYAGMALLFLLLSFSQGIIHTCYLYLGINMFLVSCCIYSVLTQPSLISRGRQFFIKKAKVLSKGAWALWGLAIIILGPYAYMQIFWLKDVNFGLDHSRLSSMWSATHYFHRLMLDQSPPADFFRRMIDFTFMPGRSFFMGYMMFFLSGLGMTMSRDRRKWIFIMAAILVWFLNFPREGVSIGLVGHWVNVLSNPLKVMVRSYQTAINSVIGYLLMPLVVMGLGVLKDLGRRDPLLLKRLRGFLIFMVIYAVNAWSYQPGIVRIYFILSMAVSLAGMALLILGPRRGFLRRMAMALFIGLMGMDMAISTWQMRNYIAENCPVRPHFLEALPPQAGLVGIDFHNPKIFPFTNQTEIYPLYVQSYLWTVRDMSLNYNSVINRQTMLTPIDNYSPRHVSFLGWPQDPLMGDYVSENNKLFFFARYAVQQRPGIFETIIRQHLAQDVMMVDGHELSVLADIPPSIASPRGNDQWFAISEDIKDDYYGWSYKHDRMIWESTFEGHIPDYFATNIFTRDPWVRFFLQSPDQKYMELAPAQGQLLRPMTFDVQNIKEGKVFAALPANTSFVGYRAVLFLKTRDASGITSVWLHHSDDTGINFQAPADGWLGIQYPYDPKWQIDMDGKPVDFYRVNKSFMGLPVRKGEHKILIRYWPHCWLRWGLPLSIGLTLFLFVGIILYALIDADNGNDEHKAVHE